MALSHRETALKNQRDSFAKSLRHAQEQIALLQGTSLGRANALLERENTDLRGRLRAAVSAAIVFALLAAALGVVLTWKQS